MSTSAHALRRVRRGSFGGHATALQVPDAVATHLVRCLTAPAISH